MIAVRRRNWYFQTGAQAGTFIELEELAVSISDMVSRELTNTLLSVRSEQVSHTHHPCPDCGKEFEILEQEPRILRGRRGENRIPRTPLSLHLLSAGFFSLSRKSWREILVLK